MRSVIAVLFVTAIAYLCGVVMGKTFNPFEWGDSFRQSVAGIWAFVVLLAAVALMKGGPMDESKNNQ